MLVGGLWLYFLCMNINSKKGYNSNVLVDFRARTNVEVSLDWALIESYLESRILITK